MHLGIRDRHLIVTGCSRARARARAAVVSRVCAVDDGWAALEMLATYAEQRQAVARVNAEQSLRGRSDARAACPFGPARRLARGLAPRNTRSKYRGNPRPARKRFEMKRCDLCSISERRI